MSVNAGGSRRATDQFVFSVALEHYLAVVADFSHIGPVLVQAHRPHQKHLAVFHETGERTEDLFAPRRHARPVAEKTLGGVVALEHVTVMALEFAHHTVVEVRRHHQAIFRGFWQLRAFG